MLDAVLHYLMYHHLDVSLDRTCIILRCTFKSCLLYIISDLFRNDVVFVWICNICNLVLPAFVCALHFTYMVIVR